MKLLLPIVALLVVGLAPGAAPPSAPLPPGAPGCHGPPPAILAAVPGGAPELAPQIAPGIAPGFGDAGFTVGRASPGAQAYALQGMRLFHAFNAPEAIRAFVWARWVDPNCALCAWGEAWARGPTINYGVDAGQAALARKAALRARDLAARGGLSEIEQGLIAAEVARHPTDLLGRARTDDKAYSDAMEALAERFPTDDAIVTEAADALLIASDDAWTDLAHRKPDARAVRARTMLETVLARSPRYTPAIHFYIHLMEWMGEPKRAEGFADTLAALAPGAGHLVHMPSHLYYRLGRYADAAGANARASAADLAYVDRLRPPGGAPAFALHAHNLSFGLSGALMDGDAAAAMDFAHQLERDFADPAGVRVRAWFAYARYAPPGEVLATKAPSAPFPQAMWRYARGEAQARLGRADAVEAEARAVASLQPRATEREVEIARLVLEGRAAMLRGRFAQAEVPLAKAARLRDGIDQRPDPPEWPYPVRRTLGAARLAAGDAAGAERELRASLATEPGDAVALSALAEAQRRLSDPAASATAAAARKAWRGDAALLALPLA